MQAYIDTTVVLRFIDTTGRLPVKPGTLLVSSELLRVEAHRTLATNALAHAPREQLLRSKRDELEQLLAAINLFPIATEIVDRACADFPIAVSSSAALHAATAELLSSELGTLEFWTHDPRQAAAAASRGLTVKGVRGGRA